MVSEIAFHVITIAQWLRVLIGVYPKFAYILLL